MCALIPRLPLLFSVQWGEGRPEHKASANAAGAWPRQAPNYIRARACQSSLNRSRASPLARQIPHNGH